MLKLAFATDANGTQGNTNYTAVRLKRIKMWAVPDPTALLAYDGMTSCSLEWQSTRGPTTLVSDTGNSFSPAHIDTKPPKDTEASFWSQVSSSTTIRNEVLFYLTCPAGTIIDVDIAYVECNGAQIASPGETLAISLVAPTTMSSYLINSLDNTTSGSSGPNQIRPVSLAWALGV